MESGGQSGSKMGLWYRKIESQCLELWHSMCNCLSGHERVPGQAVCLPAVSSSAVMVGSAAWILHKACFTVVMPYLQSDLHQNSCRGLVKIA